MFAGHVDALACVRDEVVAVGAPHAGLGLAKRSLLVLRLWL